MTVAILDKLHDRGFEVRPDPPELVVTYSSGGEPPPDTQELLEELRLHKHEVLAALWSEPAESTEWDYAAACSKRTTAFVDWAQKVTPPGCLAWLLENGYEQLRDELDTAFDVIDEAFERKDSEALARALGRFRHVVNQAIDTFTLATEPQETVQTPNAE